MRNTGYRQPSRAYTWICRTGALMLVGIFLSGCSLKKEVTFQGLDPARHDGRNCLRLKSIEHPDWPAGTSAPIPVGKGATSIYILHGALSGREMSESPCAIWSATFVGGHTSSFSVFEGREIGAIGATKDLENWQVAWRKKTEDGKWVTFGVTRWPIYSDAPIVSLSCRSYHGAPPVVVAVTVVEEPPPPPAPSTELSEEDRLWDINE